MFDALGMLAGTAVQGKAAGPVEGDSFDDFTADLSPAQIAAFFDAPDPRALAVAYLGTATTRILYDLDRVPVCAASIARETHVSALAPGQQTDVQLHFVYSDGFGREAQTKAPGGARPARSQRSQLARAESRAGSARARRSTTTRASRSGSTSPSSARRRNSASRNGASAATLFYDPLERVVATLHPNNTFEKVVFDPWRQTTYDVNDTVTFDPKTRSGRRRFFRPLPDADYLPTWYQQRIAGALGPDELAAAQKAATHAEYADDRPFRRPRAEPF